MQRHSFRFFSAATLPFLFAGCAGTAGDPGTIDTSAGTGQSQEALSSALTSVPNANPKSPGLTSATALSPELIQTVAAQGSIPVENPASVTKADGTVVTIGYYGY